jgi:hypothetical protein
MSDSDSWLAVLDTGRRVILGTSTTTNFAAMHDSTNNSRAVETRPDSAQRPQSEAAPPDRPLSEDAGLEIEALSAMFGTVRKEKTDDKTRKNRG